MDPTAALEWLQSLNPALGYTILLLGSLIEYIFPPFPGDTITLAGAVMVGSAGWSWVVVLGVTTVGSVLGALLDFELGRWLQSSTRDTWLHRRLRTPGALKRIERLKARFTRHGAAFILVNRFLPAIRGVFFLAAGMAGLRRSAVLFYAFLSALAWNGLILGVGAAVGFNLPRLVELLRQYTTVAWVLVGGGALIWGGIKLVGWWRARGKPSGDDTPGSP